MNKTHPRILILRLAVCLVLPLAVAFSGCRGKTGQGSSPTQAMRDPVTGEYAPIVSNALTGIYRPEETYRIEDGELDSVFVPYFDPETGALTAFSRTTEEIALTDENGEPMIDRRGNPLKEIRETMTLRVLLPDGIEFSSLPLPIRDSWYYYRGQAAEEGVWWLSYGRPEENPLGTMEFELRSVKRDGSESRCVSVSDLFAEPKTQDERFGFRFLFGKDGTAFASAGCELAVLDETYARLYSVAAEDTITELWLLPDGTPAFLTGSYPSVRLWTLDEAGRKAALRSDLSGVMGRFIFGPGADYYLQDNEGVHLVTGEESVLLLNKQNSALTDETFLIAAAAPEVFVGSDMAEEPGILRLYRRASDIDLSAVKVIEVANAMYYTNDNIRKKITEYNRTHPETRVVLTDTVNRDGEFSERYDRLCFNLANGFYKPDIVIADFGAKPADVLLAKNLYRDLKPYLEKDDAVRFDDLFGAVRATFTDKNGGLWGITPEFCVSTLSGRDDVLGKYAKKESWTLDETLDFLTSRPTGTVGLHGLSQENWTVLLGPAGFNRWIDYDMFVCHFDREDFGRLLHMISSLPKTVDEYFAKTYFWSGMTTLEMLNDYTPYQDGRIGLTSTFLQGFIKTYELEVRFGTEAADAPRELRYIGYPTENGGDTLALQTDTVCVITSYCEDPDAAWDLIRTFFEDPKGSGSVLGNVPDIFYSMTFPSLRSAFDRSAEVFDSYYMVERINDATHRTQSVAPLPENGVPVLSGNERAILIRKELVEKIRSLLDGASCTPYVDYTPSEIEDIVFEEVSAFLGGGADAGKCVRNIQSRVSIWLAEHK